MLNLSRIQAISLDLDDTLWPIWPTIRRAEEVLLAWLADHAPATARLHASPEALRHIRERVGRDRPDLHHDLSAMRRESIRLALAEAGDDPALAEPAFDIFFAERQNVEPYPDVVQALDHLAARYPLVAVTNGNADVGRTGLGRYFKAALTAREAGVAKPDARIFEAAARALRVPSQGLLHGGDDVALDVLGAQDAGLQAAWVNREEKLWPHDHRAPELECLSLIELAQALT